MESTVFQKITELLSTSRNIAIAVAKNPSIDEMAAGLSLFLALESSKKPVSIATPEDPLVEVSTLVGVDRVKKEFTSSDGDLTVSFPYREGEIDKVSYTLEDGSLNIVVKAGEIGLSFDQKDVRYKRSQASPDLLFVIGSPRVSDLGKLFDATALKDTTVVNIDNKSENQGFGDIVYVNPKASSVSELMANLLISLNFPLDIDISQNLLDGISFATNNFSDPKTSAVAFETIAVLLRNGAERQKVKARLQAEESLFAPRIVLEKKEALTEVKADELKEEGEVDLGNPPEDWLTPKVYKGSTNFEG